MEKQIELFIMNFMRRRTQMAFYSSQIFHSRAETAARDEIDTTFRRFSVVVPVMLFVRANTELTHTHELCS